MEILGLTTLTKLVSAEANEFQDCNQPENVNYTRKKTNQHTYVEVQAVYVEVQAVATSNHIDERDTKFKRETHSP